MSKIIKYAKKGGKNQIFNKTQDMSETGQNWGYSQNFMTLGPKMSLGGVKIPNCLIFIRSGVDDAHNHVIEQFYDPHMTSHA